MEDHELTSLWEYMQAYERYREALGPLPTTPLDPTNPPVPKDLDWDAIDAAKRALDERHERWLHLMRGG